MGYPWIINRDALSNLILVGEMPLSSRLKHRNLTFMKAPKIVKNESLHIILSG